MKKKSILLVEDNADDEFITVKAIKESKIENEIVVAHDGEEALDYIFRKGKYSDLTFDDLPTLIILDLKLPKKNGLEVLEEIRNNPETQFIPVIILTSFEEENDLTKSYQKGANSFVVKPVDVNKFKENVQKLSVYWLIVNEDYAPKK